MRFARLAALATVVLVRLAAPPGVGAQPAKVARVGWLEGEGVFTPTGPLTTELLRGLREQGYTEGQNLGIEYRSAGGRNEAFPALAAELVRLKVDVIVAHGEPATLAALGRDNIRRSIKSVKKRKSSDATSRERGHEGANLRARVYNWVGHVCCGQPRPEPSVAY